MNKNMISYTMDRNKKIINAIKTYDINQLMESMKNIDGNFSKNRCVYHNNYAMPVLVYIVFIACSNPVFSDQCKNMILELLRNEIDIQYTGNIKYTAIQYAATYNRMDIVDYICTINEYFNECKYVYFNKHK